MHPLCKSCAHTYLSSCPTLSTDQGCRNWIPRNGPGDWATNIVQDKERDSAISDIAVNLFATTITPVTDTTSLARDVVFAFCDYLVAAMLMDPRFMELLKNRIVERVDGLREDCVSNDESEIAREIVEFLVTYLQGDVPAGDFSARR